MTFRMRCLFVSSSLHYCFVCSFALPNSSSNPAKWKCEWKVWKYFQQRSIPNQSIICIAPSHIYRRLWVLEQMTMGLLMSTIQPQKPSPVQLSKKQSPAAKLRGKKKNSHHIEWSLAGHLQDKHHENVMYCGGKRPWFATFFTIQWWPTSSRQSVQP